jgi:hypothetical protein
MELAFVITSVYVVGADRISVCCFLRHFDGLRDSTPRVPAISHFRTTYRGIDVHERCQTSSYMYGAIADSQHKETSTLRIELTHNWTYSIVLSLNFVSMVSYKEPTSDIIRTFQRVSPRPVSNVEIWLETSFGTAVVLFWMTSSDSKWDPVKKFQFGEHEKSQGGKSMVEGGHSNVGVFVSSENPFITNGHGAVHLQGQIFEACCPKCYS